MELLDSTLDFSTRLLYDSQMHELHEYFDEIQKLASEGKSDQRIAGALPIKATGQQIYRFRVANQIDKPKAKWSSRLDVYAEEIRRLYVDERRTDNYIAEALPIEITQDAVRAYRLDKLKIPTNRGNRSSERYVGEDLYEQIKDELPQVWKDSERWDKKRNRMTPSSERVAKHYGITPSTAQRLLRRAGLLTSRPSIKAYGEGAKELFDQGWSIPRIAKELGQKNDTIRNWLNELGCDLSHHVSRMDHQEKLAWRGSISDAKAKAEDTTRKFPYGEHVLGSKWEIIVAQQCDRVGLFWRPYSRLNDGVLDIEKEDGHVSRYAPDLVVEHGGRSVNVEVKGIYGPLDQLKVTRWRDEKGPLALVLKEDILELEHATSTEDAFTSIRACIYSDPQPKRMDWRR